MIYEREPGADHPLYLSTVVLRAEQVGVVDGRRYPAGTTGTVVTVFGNGEAFDVDMGDDLVCGVRAGDLAEEGE